MRKTLNFYCLLIVAMAFVSCEKFTEDEDLGGAEANSTLPASRTTLNNFPNIRFSFFEESYSIADNL